MIQFIDLTVKTNQFTKKNAVTRFFFQFLNSYNKQQYRKPLTEFYDL